MTLSRNARRRLALYGTATAVVLLLLRLPWLVSKIGPRLSIRQLGTEQALKHESVAMLRDLIRIDTTNPPGITKEAVSYLARAFDCEGIPYEVVGDDAERPILVARLAGRDKREALLLLNHVDVAPPGDPSAWTVPPFAGEMGTGMNSHYLYGRGTLDMKGQATASFYAMASLRRSGIPPLRDVVYVAEPGEEAYTPEVGIGWVVEHRPDLLAGVTDVFNEGGVNETIGSDIMRFGIEVMQKASVNVRLGAKTEQELKDFRTFVKEEDKKQTFRLVPPVPQFMQFIGPSRNDIWGRSLVVPDRAVNAAWFRQWAPDFYQSLLRDGYYPGVIEKEKTGGYGMDLAVTLLPGSSTREAYDRIGAWARERRLTMKTNILTPDCVASPQSGRAWDALTTALSLDAEKADVGIYVLTYNYTNSAYMRAHGYRAYGVSPFNVNIADAGRIHNLNERIVLAYFVEGVERLSRIVREYATSL